eukprot:31800-Rhodomonas_salina.1
MPTTTRSPGQSLPSREPGKVRMEHGLVCTQDELAPSPSLEAVQPCDQLRNKSDLHLSTPGHSRAPLASGSSFILQCMCVQKTVQAHSSSRHQGKSHLLLCPRILHGHDLSLRWVGTVEGVTDEDAIVKRQVRGDGAHEGIMGAVVGLVTHSTRAPGKDTGSGQGGRTGK